MHINSYTWEFACDLISGSRMKIENRMHRQLLIGKRDWGKVPQDGVGEGGV